MNDEKLLEIIAGVLELDASEISLAENLRERNWDSLAEVMFIAEIDDALGVTLDAKKLSEAQTGEDLRVLVETALT